MNYLEYLKDLPKTVAQNTYVWSGLQVATAVFFIYYLKYKYGFGADILEPEFWIFVVFSFLLIMFETIKCAGRSTAE